MKKLLRYAGILVFFGAALFFFKAEAEAATHDLYYSLNENEQEVYEAIENFLEYGGPETVRLKAKSKPNSAQFERIENVYTNDNPYTGYLSNYINITWIRDEEDGTYYIHFDQVRDYQADYLAMRAEVQRIAGNLTGSDWDKIKVFHDYLCDKVEYDLDADVCRTPYAALINGRAVCVGYAHAFQALCKEAGIHCYLVRGQGLDKEGNYNGAHRWNVVQIDDGDWYEMDVTWDDGDTKRYKYFCVPSETMNKNHARTDSMRGFETIVPVTRGISGDLTETLKASFSKKVISGVKALMDAPKKWIADFLDRNNPQGGDEWTAPFAD